MTYQEWSSAEIRRLDKAKFPTSIREMIQGSFETAWVCTHCKYGKPHSTSLPCYSPLREIGVFVQGPKIPVGDGMALPTTVLLSGLKVEKLRDIFVLYLPKMDCLYCVQCGLVAPWPKDSGMWRTEFRKSCA